MSDLRASEGEAAVPRRTADEILAMELPQAFRGYRMRDVDALLGELALQVDAMRAELDRALGAAPGVTVAAAGGLGSTGAAEPETVPIDDRPPRETVGVGAGVRRRALLPSAALTLLAAVALLVGWLGQHRSATLAAIAGSALALVGVVVAVWRTRDRAPNRASAPPGEGTDCADDADGADGAERTGHLGDAGPSSEG